MAQEKSTLNIVARIFLALTVVKLVLCDEEPVTCGSYVMVKHKESGFYLHSHSINWGSGSQQQSVTGHEGNDDQENLWLVKEGHGDAACELGEPIECGRVIRLTHLPTQTNLHTHLFKSVLSNQQEVSCYGEGGEGDTGDNWELVCTSKGATTWKRGQPVRLKSVDTKRYLHSHEEHRFNQRNCRNCPIIGQQEVTCFQTKGTNNLWYADKGVYFPPPEGEEEEEEDEY
mmetsp:Transcript_23215/g.33742  ORF Transcript_23215/g.33742 Transcript_23215/m.33742 type:complete len:229 (-) Transcript_23215:90-776(-)|eukprot:CAMPEP_0113944452 /NCGR_PEP_ID=MMETSP1339-20121228/34431_1 /TAXON_ID=94617 /ORGANISM="Fibrocapsa japonica" /LENGTH=228 /DNA_ID=CAMNT_0000949665 /DNA_START=57 /DNA_END=743 /DNA_ORIENTATION=- /assembly_acc=CAM_ASM_000762